MALQAEHVQATPSGLEYKPRYSERPRALSWRMLRSITAEVEPAWSGAEITVSLAFEGAGAEDGDVPLARGQRLEVFGNLGAARAMIESAQAHSPEALVGPLAQLVVGVPEREGGDEAWYRSKLKDYAFAPAAGLALGKQHLARGRLLAAERAFAGVVRRDPRDAAAWRLLGLTRTLAGQGRKAEIAVNHLLGLGVRDTEAYLLHDFGMYRQRRFDLAAEGLERVRRAQSGDPAIRNMLACSLIQQWRIPDAMRELNVLASDAREGWRLMARKCTMCGAGYRA
ncbi:MAG: hypothetical protein JSV65_03780 [Armatimonadota bacterium]|nr:MAG: hypothetical protein JSV65_03780 [Armatimonadota bacterium]